jgi:hypothetical protein
MGAPFYDLRVSESVLCSRMDGEFIFTANERGMEESLHHVQEELIKVRRRTVQ